MTAEMPLDQYLAEPGLSNSGLDDLSVSPLRYWHLHINPERPPEEDTPAMRFGSALHCAVLEPMKFDGRYVCEIELPEKCLVTIEDLRGWLRDVGLTPKGTRKADIVEQARSAMASGCDPVPIWDIELAKWTVAAQGRTSFKPEVWRNLIGAAESLRSELAHLDMRQGQVETCLTGIDPQHGVCLKGRIDFLAPAYTLDLKTFTQQRGKSIDKSVNDAIWYEKYYRQAYFYSYLRSLQPGFLQPGIAAKAPPFVLAFVESEPPFEVRLRSLLPKHGGEVNLYWERARIEVRGLISQYAEYSKHYGEKPWRDGQIVEPINDEDLPGVTR